MTIRNFELPPKVNAMLEAWVRRLHHFIWHSVRYCWHRFLAAVRQELTSLGWEPPLHSLLPCHELSMDDLRQPNQVGGAMPACRSFLFVSGANDHLGEIPLNVQQNSFEFDFPHLFPESQ